MDQDLVLGLDCSTTAAKAVVWSLDGTSISVGRQAYGLSTPRPGWGEQDPVDWWSATVAAIGFACRRIDPSRLAAICITHQRETFVCLDRDGHALRPAMLWLDTRATDQVARLGTDRIHRITGKPPNTATGWYKLAWLAEHEPRVIDSTVRVTDVHSYLVNRLTGDWRTSYGSVDPLGVLDLQTFQLSGELVDQVGLRPDHFPELCAPGDVLGVLRDDVAALLGLNRGLKVVAGLGDGQSAGLGVGITQPGEAYLNLGTGIVSGNFSAEYGIDRSFRTMTGGVPGTYLYETFFGGGTYNLNWFVQQFSGIGERPFGLDLLPEQILESAATALPAGADGLLSLPYLTGVLTPYWDSTARGVMFGLTGQHGKAHVYRSILEGLAMEQRLSTTGADAASAIPIRRFLAMGGGARSPLWCQIMADVLGKPVTVAREPEATSLGAGILAAYGAGCFGSVQDAAAAMTGVGKTYMPQPAQSAKYDKLYDLYKDIYPALRDHFTRLRQVMADIS